MVDCATYELCTWYDPPCNYGDFVEFTSTFDAGLSPMVLVQLLGAIRRFWQLVVVCGVAGVLTAGATALVLPNSYESTAKGLLSIRSTSTIDSLVQGNAFVLQTVHSYARVATSRYILEDVIRAAGLKVSADTLSQKVRVSVEPGTAILDVTVTSSDGTNAAFVANAIIDRLRGAVPALSPVSEGMSSPLVLTKVQTAIPPSFPSSPDLIVLLASGGAAGLCSGFFVAYLRRDPSNMAAEIVGAGVVVEAACR